MAQSKPLLETVVSCLSWFECVRSTLVCRGAAHAILVSQSVRCNLRNLSSADLIKRHEEPEEFGGYFIINGNDSPVLPHCGAEHVTFTVSF